MQRRAAPISSEVVVVWFVVGCWLLVVVGWLLLIVANCCSLVWGWVLVAVGCCWLVLASGGWWLVGGRNCTRAVRRRMRGWPPLLPRYRTHAAQTASAQPATSRRRKRTQPAAARRALPEPLLKKTRPSWKQTCPWEKKLTS